MKIGEHDALIVVDVQNDFCPGGALPVPAGDGVVHPINRAMCRFELVVFTRDWHPADHCSFSEDPRFADGSWPEHCVEDTPGAEFHGSLRVPLDAPVVSKGCDAELEEYSGFARPALEQWLRAHAVARVLVCGLATEYCVKATVLDAIAAGFETWVLRDGCRGITDAGAQAALEAMAAAGAHLVFERDLE